MLAVRGGGRRTLAGLWVYIVRRLYCLIVSVLCLLPGSIFAGGWDDLPAPRIFSAEEKREFAGFVENDFALREYAASVQVRVEQNDYDRITADVAALSEKTAQIPGFKPGTDRGGISGTTNSDPAVPGGKERPAPSSTASDSWGCARTRAQAHVPSRRGAVFNITDYHSIRNGYIRKRSPASALSVAAIRGPLAFPSASASDPLSAIITVQDSAAGTIRSPACGPYFPGGRACS